MGKSKGDNLRKAKKEKNDEFYTQLSDIENEMRHYKEHFKGKVVLCNCDDPSESNFFKYFAYNFEHLGLKKLVTTCYKGNGKGCVMEYTGDKNGDRIPNPEEVGIRDLDGDGDFRSPECIEILKEADIVVTNPPFSLFREYVSVLMEYRKKFIIIGSINAILYKETFKFIKSTQLWLGNEVPKVFIKPDGKTQNFGNICWYTNIPHKKRNDYITLWKTYKGNEKDYPKYDNYDAIEVSKVKDIPVDYIGVMGVPITFLDKYNPKQFDLLGSNRGVDQDENKVYGRGSNLGNKETFKRLFIRRKQGV